MLPSWNHLSLDIVTRISSKSEVVFGFISSYCDWFWKRTKEFLSAAAISHCFVCELPESKHTEISNSVRLRNHQLHRNNQWIITYANDRKEEAKERRSRIWRARMNAQEIIDGIHHQTFLLISSIYLLTEQERISVALENYGLMPFIISFVSSFDRRFEV